MSNDKLFEKNNRRKPKVFFVKNNFKDLIGP